MYFCVNISIRKLLFIFAMNTRCLLLFLSMFLTGIASFAQHEILDYSTLSTADRLYEYEESALACQRDSLNIFGKIYRPMTPNSQKIPVVIHAHGYNSSHGEPEPYAKGLAMSGYANVIFDFCGGGNLSKSEGRTTDMSVFTEQRDVEAVIDMLSTLDWVDTNHISYGLQSGRIGFFNHCSGQSYQDSRVDTGISSVAHT